MSAHYIPSSSEFMDGAEPIVGAVYASKQCNILAESYHGRTGWRATLENGGLISTVEVFFCDKGGLARWLTRAEFEATKAKRSLEWIQAYGKMRYLERCRRRQQLEAVADLATNFAT